MSSPPLGDSIDVDCRLLERDIACVYVSAINVLIPRGETLGHSTQVWACGTVGVTRLSLYYLFTLFRVAKTPIRRGMAGQSSEVQLP